MATEMINDINKLFVELLKSTESRKVDFKSEQYRLDNEVLKSQFVKDILCIANAKGDDGYILLGVKSEKGRPRHVIGISQHYDSSDLEAIVNGVINEPIQFEYYPLNYRSKECALIYIPSSKAKPHWPKRDYGILKRHIFYTRRASANREASIPEIREICLETIRISDIAQQRAKRTAHVVDELADMSLDEREPAMHKMLKSIAPQIGLMRYKSIYNLLGYRHICTLVSSRNNKVILDYAVFMYPWTTKSDEITTARYSAMNLRISNGAKKVRESTRKRLNEGTLVHVSYKNIHTKALEMRPYSPRGYYFANEWNLPWGRVMKWEDIVPQMNRNKTTYSTRVKYEFFVPNVSSKGEMKERFENLLAWVDANIV